MDPLSKNEQDATVVEENEGEGGAVSASNLHVIARHLFLTLCVLLTISIVFFLIYQNGKSIYDKGI